MGQSSAWKLHQLMTVRLAFPTRVVWAHSGAVLAAAHGGGVAAWQGAFGGPPAWQWSSDTPVKALAAHPQAGVAAGTAGGVIAILNATGQMQAHLATGVAAVTALTFTAGGDRVLAAFDTGAIRVFATAPEVRAMPEITIASGETASEIPALAHWHDDVYIARRDGELHIVRPGSEHSIVCAHPDWVRALSVDAQSGDCATACKDGVLRLWQRDGTLSAEHAAHAGGCDAVSMWRSGGDLFIATGGRDAAVRVWRGQQRALSLLAEHAPTGDAARAKPCLSAAWSGHAPLLATASGDHTVALWRLAMTDNGSLHMAHPEID
jgi:WD40 repeat protein